MPWASVLGCGTSLYLIKEQLYGIQPGVRLLCQRRLLYHHAQVVSKGSRPGAHTMILQMDINLLKDSGLHGHLPSRAARAA
jgi:hypothetical protein